MTAYSAPNSSITPENLKISAETTANRSKLTPNSDKLLE